VVYGAAWEGKPIELFAVRDQSSESSAINLAAADMLAISSTGEMAVSLKAASQGPFIVAGTLARAPLAGGGARELLEGVLSADWSPDGQQMAAVVRASPSTRATADARTRVEYPLGTVLYSAPFWISNPRISRDGATLAFITHAQGGDEGDVEIIDIASKERRTLSAGWISIEGLAWAPGGREVWFTATKTGGMRALWAVSLDGRERLVFRAPQRLTLLDVTADGRALISGSTMRTETQFGSIREKVERKLSWFDWASNVSLSADARLLAFTESGEGAGEKYGVYVRPTDGSPAVRLGDGAVRSLSPDGKWVAAEQPGSGGTSLQILPTGAGETRKLDLAPLERSTGTRWFPDSRRLVIVGNEKGHKPRTYELSLDGGAPKAITPEGVTGLVVSPDGRWLAVVAPDGVGSLFALPGGPLKTIPGVTAADLGSGWLADSRAVIVRTAGSPVQISRIDIETGSRTPLGTVAPADPAGVVALGQVAFAPDGDHYVFNYFRVLSELYIVDGLK
jgi:Tol biopolymer transport system component